LSRASAADPVSPRPARDSAAPTRVCHVITGLGTGGAEMMLYKLVRSLDPDRIASRVVSLGARTPLADRIADLGVPVTTLDMRGPFSPRLPGAIRRLTAVIRDWRPDVVQGWMYHGNIAAQIAARLAGSSAATHWNVRQTVYRLRDNSLPTMAVIKAGAWMSRGVDRVIYNSRTSRAQHAALGYADDRALIIPNGFDCAEFTPNPAMRATLRAELGLAPDATIVGHVARYHPMKDHATLVRAAAIVARRHPTTHWVLAGTDVTRANNALREQIAALGLTERVHLLGERRDVAAITCGFDVACSSSAWGEGFPNVIGEAMACGISCVATDVGDSRWVLGDCGRVVPRGDAEALANAIAELISAGGDKRRALGSRARDRVCSEFAIERVAEQYESLYAPDAVTRAPQSPSGLVHA